MQEINKNIKISYFAIPGVERKCRINCKIILDKVCEYFNVHQNQLIAKGNFRHSVTPRHIAMYLMRTRTHESLLSIGQMFNRDHTTVINAVSKINGFLSIRDETTVRAIETINGNLRSNN